MFTNKKFLAALLCTPLFGACVVNGDDEGADSGSTGPTTTASTTASTTDSTTASTTDSTTASTTDSTTVSTESGTTEPMDTSAGTETGQPGGMGCFLACEAPEDCCGGDAMCEMGIGTYPYSYTCEADGTCGYTGCADAEECTLGGILMNQVCVQTEGIGFCWTACEMDMDCEDAFLMGWTCTGDDGAGGAYCEPPGCTEDADCGKTGTCEADGTCSYPGCMSDDDCPADFGGGVCNTDSGGCECATTDDCAKGFTCAAF
jgi:hypothetical protein